MQESYGKRCIRSQELLRSLLSHSLSEGSEAMTMTRHVAMQCAEDGR